MRIPKISTVAMLALVAVGCGNSDATNRMSTDVNSTEDAEVDDVLGANEVASNDTRSP